jgi:carbonic anhydrase
VRRVAVADGQAIIDPTRLDASHVGAEHVRDTIADVLRDSELVAAAVAEGRLGIVGANYRLIDGAVQAHTVLGLAS